MHNDVTAMRGELQLIRSALRAPDLPVELDLEELSDEQMLNFAAKLCHVRPLVPYPRWRFGSDWSNPDTAFQFRKQIWTHCRDQAVSLPFHLDWHHGIKLELHLGNDLSLLIFGYGCYEPNEFALLERFLLPGMNVVDAGANEGLYSLFAAAKVGREGHVWAVEPSDRELRRLSANLALNAAANVSSHRLALSNENGSAQLIVASDEHGGHNSLGKLAYASTESLHHEAVQTQTLDAFVDANQVDRIDFLKIDVEGAEERLIEGGRRAIARFLPVILFEASERSLLAQGGSVGGLCGTLRAQNYEIFRFDESTGLAVPATDGIYSENLIAVPVERPLPDRVFQMIL